MVPAAFAFNILVVAVFTFSKRNKRNIFLSLVCQVERQTVGYFTHARKYPEINILFRTEAKDNKLSVVKWREDNWSSQKSPRRRLGGVLWQVSTQAWIHAMFRPTQ